MPKKGPPKDELVIEDPKVLKLVLDPVRYRMFRSLSTPKSATELAGLVGVPANRLYYHLRLLDRAGLIKQVDVRVSGNHAERMWGLAARRITADRDIARLDDIRAEEAIAVLGSLFHELAASARAQEAGEFGADGVDFESSLRWSITKLSVEQAREVDRRTETIIEEVASLDFQPGEGARTYGLLFAMTPLLEGAASPGESERREPPARRRRRRKPATPGKGKAR